MVVGWLQWKNLQCKVQTIGHTSYSIIITLTYRHHGVPNHRKLYCCFNSLFRPSTRTTIRSILMTLLWGKYVGSMGIPFPKSRTNPDNEVHGANMVPTWVLSAPGGLHVGLMNLDIWVWKAFPLDIVLSIDTEESHIFCLFIAHSLCCPPRISYWVWKI